MMDSGSNSGGRDPAWKYRTHVEGNRNCTIYKNCGFVIKSCGITRFKFYLSHADPHSNTKKCPNVPPEVKQEIRQLLDQKNKAKAKKAIDIEIRAKLRGTMGGLDRHLINEDEDEDEEEDEDDVYMYPANMTPDERAEF